MQFRNRTIEFIPPLALATMIDEYAIFGPKSGDRFPSFFGVSLSEYIVEVAFKGGLYRIRHGSLTVWSNDFLDALLAATRERAESGAQFLDESGGAWPFARLRLSSCHEGAQLF